MKSTLGLVLIILGTVQDRNEAYGKPGKDSSNVPDLCQSPDIDAVTKTGNGDTYAFIGEYYWRILAHGIADGYPRVIKDDWDGLPGNLNAALTSRDGKTFFFKDSRYWRFQNKKMDGVYPKEIKRGFRGIPDNIDAALLWSGNGKTYFFKGSQYWRFDSQNDVPVSDAYPKPISTWKGIPNDLDAAFQWDNGKTYFFKDQHYYRLNDNELAVEQADPSFPRSTAVWWFDCKDIPRNDTVKHGPIDTSDVTERYSDIGGSVSARAEYPISEITSTSRATQPESSSLHDDEDLPKDSVLPQKGSFDVGIWDYYSTSDESTVNDLSISDENSKTGLSTIHDNTTPLSPTTFTITHNFSNTSAVVNNKQSILMPGIFFLLNMLLTLWY